MFSLVFFSFAAQSSVYLSPRSFEEPLHYLLINFNASDVESIANYLEGTGPNFFKIRVSSVEFFVVEIF